MATTKPQTSYPPLLTMPNEILSKILVHTTQSKVPIYLRHFLDLGHKFQFCKADKAEHDSKSQSGQQLQLLPSNALTHSKEWFLAELDPSQKEHFLDWLVVNSTCHRFRALEKTTFFSEKTFVIAPSLVPTLQDRNGITKHFNIAGIVLAFASIRHIIAP